MKVLIQLPHSSFGLELEWKIKTYKFIGMALLKSEVWNILVHYDITICPFLRIQFTVHEIKESILKTDGQNY